DLFDIRNPEPGRSSPCRGPVGPGHADKRNAGHLNELLEREQPESAAADHTQSNEVVVHGSRSFDCKYERRIILRSTARRCKVEPSAIIPARRGIEIREGEFAAAQAAVARLSGDQRRSLLGNYVCRIHAAAWLVGRRERY